jgi:hypothetical protein
MARYFLHQRCGDSGFPDEEGQECPSVEAARRQAIAGIRSILADEIMHGYMILDQRIDICDERGARVATIPFSEAFELRH